MKILKNLLLIILFSAIIIGLNYYLKKNNFLFYSSGSKEKAFINSTWEMSPNEIQRTNKTNLIPGKLALFDITDQDGYEYPQVIKMERYKLLKQKEYMTLWGFKTNVEYGFFDDKLFEYTLFLEGYDSNKMHNKITSALAEKYGNGVTDDNKNYLHSMKWETNSERVSYWIFEKEDKGNVKLFLAGVRKSYKPMLGKISKISFKEYKKLF